MITCTARRTRSERSAPVPSRPSMSARSRSRVFSVAAILFITGCSLRAPAPTESPFSCFTQAGCIPNLFPANLRLHPLDESPEPIVHAGAEDVVIELDIARCDVSEAEGRGAERGVVVEVDIEIFALDRPAVTERVFDAAADGRS